MKKDDAGGAVHRERGLGTRTESAREMVPVGQPDRNDGDTGEAEEDSACATGRNALLGGLPMFVKGN